MRYIFDLDGTVIDSTHRQGDTLDDWRRLNTARNVALDSPLPLLDQMRDAIAKAISVDPSDLDGLALAKASALNNLLMNLS